MGQVYRATDRLLKRDVALKVLPADTAAHPDRLERFQREAQAVAALNHPNVVTIYSVEHEGSTHFLTMEFVEGRTLAEIIPREGLALDRFLATAVPLADAVSAAHARGIVHRDLKPANVMIGADGRVKVLDFGLAKLRADAGDTSQPDRTTALLTAPHVVMGTAAYMSPEQAEGKTADAPSDVFSLGVVLFEMATGARPFEGESSAALVSAILRDTPPQVTEIRPELPADLARVIRRCLAKEPAGRYRTAQELRDDLVDLRDHPSRHPAAPPPAPGQPARRPVRWGRVVAGFSIAMSMLFTIAVLWKPLGSLGGGSSPVFQNFQHLSTAPGIEWFPSLAPDCQWVVYAGDASGNRDIYFQSVTGQNAINLTAASPADDDQPAFSPDGSQIAFRSARDGGGIWVMGRTGEAVRRVTREGFNPAWSNDGTQIVYSTWPMELRPGNFEGNTGLKTVAVNGGTPTDLYKEDASLPRWSPHGYRIAFSQRFANLQQQQSSIMTIAADGTGQVIATTGSAMNWNPIWAPDGKRLYFVSNRGGSTNVWSVAIDERSGRVNGEPEAVTTPSPFAAHLTMSGDGRCLAYSAINETMNIHSLGLNPATGETVGDPKPVTTGSRYWANPDPSPDGKQIVMYTHMNPEGDVYIINSDGSGLRQLTSDTATDRVPRWSPDGQWITFFSDRGGGDLHDWQIRTDGSDLQQVPTAPYLAGTAAWSPDGTRLAMNSTSNDQTFGGMITLAHQPGAKLTLMPPLPAPEARYVPNSWSPDGRYLIGQVWYGHPGIVVYDLDTKRYETIATFGEWPVWLPDGRHALFVSGGRAFHVVDRVTKDVKKVFSVTRDTLGPPRLTKDGKTMYFSRRITESDVWTAIRK